MLKGKKNIIWDWNGTLINDLGVCISAMNSMLQERKIPLLTETHYKEIFCFPVRDYYEKIGFDFNKEPFEMVGLEFMKRYKEISNQATLTENVNEVLLKLQESGCRQFVLSAMEQHLLKRMLTDYGIIQFFDGIYGISDDYGGGKISMGNRLLAEQKIDKNRTLMIGDTLHDAEVADSMKIDCLLYSGGHQSKKRLLSSQKTVISDLLIFL